MDLIENSMLIGVLNMIDPEHSIILNDKVGLLGTFDETDATSTTSKTGKTGTTGAAFKDGLDELNVAQKDEIARIYAMWSINKRGTSFRVIGEQGTGIIPYSITHTFIMQNESHMIDRPAGYVFIVKGRSVEDMFEELKPMLLVLNQDGTMETNYMDISNDEETRGFDIKYNADIDIECIKLNRSYTITTSNGYYKSYMISRWNNIYYLEKMSLRLDL